MLEVEPLRGLHLVADPTAIDALLAALPPGVTTIRVAPDEALLFGVSGVGLDDPHAIVEPETGFVAVTVERDVIERHTEWPLPAAVTVAQGAVAGVPAKLAWLPDGRGWVVVQAAHADELLDRLR